MGDSHPLHQIPFLFYIESVISNKIQLFYPLLHFFALRDLWV